MILINGTNEENVLVQEWKDLYNIWIGKLSTKSLLKWVSNNYALFHDDTTTIEYWFIGEERFCEIYYTNDFGIDIIVIIVDECKNFNHTYSYIHKTIIIDKKVILRDLLINKII